VLLIPDGHTSHKSLKAINTCRDNGIFMVTIPPHTSNKLERLDVAAKANHPSGRVTDYTLGPIIREAHIRAFTPHKVMKGFQQVVISSFNPDVFTGDFTGACAVY
jgi:hypothetical protein